MSIEIIAGKEAIALLEQDKFRENWIALSGQCPWATGFQGFYFVSRWYETYREHFEPLLLLQFSSDKQSLEGLLPLAISRGSGQIVNAGAHQAEYQVWLAVPSLGNRFIEEAFNALRTNYPGQTIVFRYLPPLAPREWLDPNRAWGSQCEIEPYARPVLDVSDETRVKASLKKNHNKTPLKHLKRLGEVSFQRITEEAELARVFDEIIANYDFRQGALNDTLPFQKDPLKKSFHLALLRAPGILHVTLLKLNDRIIAANLGVHDGTTVHLGVYAYSPLFAKYSPGKLHLLFMAESMNPDGFAALDLTPGGEWKDRLCSHHDEVYQLRVFLDRRQLLKHRAAVRGLAAAKAVVQRFKLDPQSLREALTGFRRQGIAEIFTAAAGKMRRRLRQKEAGFYRLTADKVDRVDPTQLMSRDSVGDLLAFQQDEGGHTRQDFLRQALQWLEKDRHVYTKVEAGRLVHYGWLVERQEKLFFEEMQRELTLPPDSAVLLDFYSDSKIKSKELCRAALRQMLRDAVEQSDVKQIFICGAAVDDGLRDAIEQLGFHRENLPEAQKSADRS